MRNLIISDSYYKSDETTTEKSIKEDLCKGNTCIKVVIRYWYPSIWKISGSWLNDGFCDDFNNHLTCNYDDGDCCGRSVNKRFCLNCTCKCKY